MKENKHLAVAVAFAMTLVCCGEKKNKQDEIIHTSQEIQQVKEETAGMADASFSDEMTGKVFHSYQQLRMALVNSNADEAKTAAGNLAQSFSEDRKDMKSTALAMANTDALEKQRELFSEFTMAVEPMFKESISDGTIYKQFCPMAFDGKGGYWISSVDEIRNPYYGDKMLKCGKIAEEISK